MQSMFLIMIPSSYTLPGPGEGSAPPQGSHLQRKRWECPACARQPVCRGVVFDEADLDRCARRQIQAGERDRSFDDGIVARVRDNRLLRPAPAAAEMAIEEIVPPKGK